MVSSHRAPVPVRLLPFFVEIQNARVWPFVIPPVRSARLQDVFPYGNCTETVRKPGKYEGAHLRGFRTIGSPWEHTLFSVTYRQRGANCACYIGVLPALLSVGFSGGRNVRKIQNYLSGEATRTFRYPRRQMFRDFETSFAFWLTAHRHLLGKQTKSTAPWLNDHGDFAGSLAGALFAFRRNSHYLRRAMHLWLTARIPRAAGNRLGRRHWSLPRIVLPGGMRHTPSQEPFWVIDASWHD